MSRTFLNDATEDQATTALGMLLEIFEPDDSPVVALEQTVTSLMLGGAASFSFDFFADDPDQLDDFVAMESELAAENPSVALLLQASLALYATAAAEDPAVIAVAEREPFTQWPAYAGVIAAAAGQFLYQMGEIDEETFVALNGPLAAFHAEVAAERDRKRDRR